MRQAFVFLAHYWKARRRKRWTDRESFDRWRERRVVRHIEFVRSRSPFYRERWNGIPSSSWRTFPPIDKSVMMAHFDRLNTVGITRSEAFAVADAAEASRNFSPALGGVTVGLSSGTSGNRGLFLVGDRERAAWAGAMLGRLLPGSLLSRRSIAFFLRANSNLYESVRSKRIVFRFYDLLVPVKDQLAALAEQRPDVIVAPPSVLRELAEARLSGRLDVGPSRVVSVAETMDPLDERRIALAFGSPIHQVYQCTEGFLACTCRHGTLHLNEDLVYIEKEFVPGRERTFVPIVTDFSRKTQPIVRYRLNDLLTESDRPCPCGSPFTSLEKIEGRCDDIFYASSLEPDGEPVTVYPDFVTRAVLGSSSGIAHYRAIQTAIDAWTIELELRDATRRSETEQRVGLSIAALCERLNCRMPALRFADYSPPRGAVKLRRVERRTPG